MGRVLSIEEMDNGWVCKKIISEGGGNRLAEAKVFEKDKKKELLAWMEPNL